MKIIKQPDADKIKHLWSKPWNGSPTETLNFNELLRTWRLKNHNISLSNTTTATTILTEDWLGLVWFGLIWFYSNHCKLFTTKYSLYTNIKYIYIWFETYFVNNILDEPKFILMHTVKWYQVLLCISNNSIKHQSFVYAQLNDQTILFLTIRFSVNHLFALGLNVKQFYATHR